MLSKGNIGVRMKNSIVFRQVSKSEWKMVWLPTGNVEIVGWNMLKMTCTMLERCRNWIFKRSAM
jgi:hypothetical protein